ncbi:MAG: hypothetical protein AAF718_05285 [Pseudomonadota bacterium]
MAFWSDQRTCKIAGKKQQALLAMLAASPEYARSRAWLIAQLWSENDEAQGRRNLRQLLHGLRALLAEGDIIETMGDLVYLTRQNIEILGDPSDGEFLEGFDLPEEGFEEWLREQRQLDVPLAATPTAEIHEIPLERSHYRIAVAPFAEAGTDIQAGIGDMLSHQLSVAIARSGLADAISHHSCRQMIGKPEEAIPEIDFWITGRCHGDGDNVVVYAKLEAARDGSVLWGERFRPKTADLVAGESDFVDQIAGQILWLIAKQSGQLSVIRPLGAAPAHVLLMNGIVEMHSFDKARFAQAGLALEEVVARSPTSTLPLAWLAQWHLLSVYQGWSEDPAKTRLTAAQTTGRALDLNPNCELSLAIDGNLLNVLDSDFSAAAQRFAAAQAVNPSSAMISQLAAVLSCFEGKGEEAVTLTERARSLAPRDPRRAFFAGIGAASYLVAGRWAEAIEETEVSLRMNPGHVSALRCRVIALQRSEQGEAAAIAARHLMESYPDFTVSAYLRDHPAAETPVGQDWARALGEAGVRMN